MASTPLHLDIVSIDDTEKGSILTQPMPDVSFPLTEGDLLFIEALKDKVLDLKAAGIAAPQVGKAQPITAFHVSKDALKWRDDIVELIPLTVFINPSYVPLEAHEKTLDWEGCLSSTLYGKVWRYKSIHYTAQDIQGNTIEGIATGFLARLLQHEIDHCHHQMCIHKYDLGSPQGTFSDLMSVRQAEMELKKQKLGLRAEDDFPFVGIK